MRMEAVADVPRGKRGSEKGEGREGEPLGETTGKISTDETR